MLDHEQRLALQAEAARLRTEISDLTAERDAANSQVAQSGEDAKLLAEVQRLQRDRDAVKAQRDQAVGSTEDALKLMLDAVVEQNSQPLPTEAAPAAANEETASDAATQSTSSRRSGGNR